MWYSNKRSATTVAWLNLRFSFSKSLHEVAVQCRLSFFLVAFCVFFCECPYIKNKRCNRNECRHNCTKKHNAFVSNAPEAQLRTRLAKNSPREFFRLRRRSLGFESLNHRVRDGFCRAKFVIVASGEGICCAKSCLSDAGSVSGAPNAPLSVEDKEFVQQIAVCRLWGRNLVHQIGVCRAVGKNLLY